MKIEIDNDDDNDYAHYPYLWLAVPLQERCSFIVLFVLLGRRGKKGRGMLQRYSSPAMVKNGGDLRRAETFSLRI